MRIPRGRLVRSRAVADPAAVLRTALDRELTGYARLAPQEAVLLDGDTRGVLTFRDGVPVLAYSVASDRGGPGALADLAMPGPYAADLYELAAEELARAHRSERLRVPPGMPAERLAGDPALAARTREAAPEDRTGTGAAADPVEAFLDDEEKIDAIRRRARREARSRAAEWGLTGELVGTPDAGGEDGHGGAGGPSDVEADPSAGTPEDAAGPGVGEGSPAGTPEGTEERGHRDDSVAEH